VEEDLRTQAMCTVYSLADANEEIKKKLGEHPVRAPRREISLNDEPLMQL
jgi:hypothetical protein